MQHAFEEVFWGPSNDPLLGVKKLHDNYQYGVSELEEILNLVQQRMMTEEYYANRLQELASVRVANNAKNDARQKDESNSMLHQVLVTMRQEATIISSTHRHMHDTLSRTYSSLKRFLDDHRKLSQTRKDAIDSSAKRFDAVRTDANDKRKDAAAKWAKAREADAVYKQGLLNATTLAPAGSMDVLVNFGEQEFTVVEFNNLVSNMERDIPKIDVKSILGTYKAVVAGSSILKYLTTVGTQHRTSLQSVDSATAFLSALISQNFLKSIALRNSNKLSISDQQYQWKKTSLDNEPAHTKTRRDAERAEMDYRNAVRIAEDARASLESSCVEHMRAIQVALLERLSLARTVISSYIDSEQSCVSPISQSVERFNVLLEMFSAERQVQAMAERDRTGNARLQPIVYSPSTSKIVVESKFVRNVVFGVSLEALAAREGRRVPGILRKCLKALVKGMCRDGSGVLGRKDEFAAWMDSSMYSTTVQSWRVELNSSGKALTLGAISSRPMSDVIGLLKLWLQQLPGSVCNNEIYEPLKLLYLSKSDEFAGMRSGSIKSLLTTLSPAHYNCLFALVSHWQKLFEETGTSKDDAKVAELSQVMGHLLLRPRVETQVTAHDKHPSRFLRDLLTHDLSDLFGPGMTPSGGSSHSLELVGEDLDADLDDDEAEDVSNDLMGSGEKITMVDASPTSDAALGMNHRASAPSIASLTGGLGTTAADASVVAGGDASRVSISGSLISSNAQPRDSLSGSDAAVPRSSMMGSLLSSAKSDEDLFLEAEAEGLEDIEFNEADLRDLELEVDQILLENPDLM
ncbi:hypothetical protein HDU81_007872 [Chytriomyces hyalinus]|nr:hypothetical protein HDU81_007872 [Chytriomyces hyalinus]